MKINRILVFPMIVGVLSGCGQSALDNCTDSKEYLWNPKSTDNQYKGNEAYWDAVATCEDEHG